MIEVAFDEEGRLVGPKGVRLRIPAEFVDESQKTVQETDEERATRVRAFFDETRDALKDEPRRALSDDDPLVAKYRRMGLLD